MKNIFKITFALLFAITIPAGHALALGFSAIDPHFGVWSESSGNSITDAIKEQTQALLVMQRQQQLAALNQKCVSDSVVYILGKDTYIKNTDKAIADYITQIQKDPAMSDPANMVQAKSHLNYLYTLRGRQSDSYFGYIIDACTNYEPQLTCSSGYYLDAATGKKCITPNQQCTEFYGSNATLHNYDVATNKLSCDCVAGTTWNSTQTACVSQQATSGLQCNGKAWSNCPVGQSFFCPSTGDAQCIINEAPAASMSTTKNIQSSTEIQKPTSNTKQIKSEPKIKTATNNASTTTSTYKKGLIPKNNQTQESIVVESAGTGHATPVAVSPQQNGRLSRMWSWFIGLFGF